MYLQLYGLQGNKRECQQQRASISEVRASALNVCNVQNGLLPFLRSPQPEGVWSWSMFAKLHCVGVSVNKPTNFRRTAQKEKTKEGQ